MGALICKPSEEELDDSSLWDFCGRVKDIEKILKKIQAKRTKTMCVYGAKSIGKSRVIRQVLLSEQLQKYEHSCYVDLSLFSQNSTDKPAFVNRLEKFCEIVQLDMKLPLTTCEKCELCTKNIGCSSLLEKVTNEFVQMQQECLVCFDNADKLMNSIFQPYFLKFLKTVTDHGKHTKLLITSTVRIHMSSKASKLYLLNEMENADLRELLDQILLESIEDDEIPKSSLNISDHWIDAVVTLCDGIPKVAEILGSILSDDDGLIEPIEMVQLLINNYLGTLNPELFPATDKPAEEYSKVLEKFNEISEVYQQTWLCKIADSVKGTIFLPDEGREAVQKDGAQVTSAAYKMNGLRKYLDYSLLQKDEDGASGALSVKRLYKHLLCKAHYVLANDNDGLNLKGIQLVHEEAESVGLDLSNVKRLDDTKVERLLNRKDLQLRQEGSDSGRSSGEENDDDSDNNDNEQRIENLTSYPDQSGDPVLHPVYDRFDSTSGPYGMSYTNNDGDLSGVSCNIDRDRRFVHGDAQMFSVPGMKQEANDIQAKDKAGACYNLRDAKTEDDYLRGAHNEIATAGSVLSNTFPTTVLRKGLQPEESFDDTKSKRECTSSTNRIYPTPVHRMSSEEYEQSIGNNYISTTEAKDAQEQESPTKRGNQTSVRYSGSSTDSGEFKLGLETRTFAKEM